MVVGCARHELNCIESKATSGAWSNVSMSANEVWQLIRKAVCTENRNPPRYIPCIPVYYAELIFQRAARVKSGAMSMQATEKQTKWQEQGSYEEIESRREIEIRWNVICQSKHDFTKLNVSRHEKCMDAYFPIEFSQRIPCTRHCIVESQRCIPRKKCGSVPVFQLDSAICPNLFPSHPLPSHLPSYSVQYRSIHHEKSSFFISNKKANIRNSACGLLIWWNIFEKIVVECILTTNRRKKIQHHCQGTQVGT